MAILSAQLSRNTITAVFRMAKGKKKRFYSSLHIVQQGQRKTEPGAHNTICSELSEVKLFDICTAMHERKDRRSLFNEKLR